LEVIFNMFTTREIALGIWLIIIFISLILWKKTRKHIFGIIKIALSKKILILFFILFLYSTTFMILFSMSQIWRNEYVKVILIWTFFAGAPLCFNAIIKGLEQGFFKNLVFDGLKFTVLVEYITGLFTFSLLIEIILLPIIAFIFAIYTFSEYYSEYENVKNFLLKIIAIITVIFFIFTFKMAIEIYPSLDPIDVMVEFSIPIVFSIIFIPLIYLFSIYSKYEQIFIRMQIKGQIVKNKKNYHKKKVFLACGLSYNKLCRFQKEFIKEMYLGMSEKEFDDIIKKFKDTNKHYSNSSK